MIIYTCMVRLELGVNVRSVFRVIECGHPCRPINVIQSQKVILTSEMKYYCFYSALRVHSILAANSTARRHCFITDNQTDDPSVIDVRCHCDMWAGPKAR